MQYYSLKADLVGEVQNLVKHKFVLGTELSYYQIILNGLSSDPLIPFIPFGPSGPIFGPAPPGTA